MMFHVCKQADLEKMGITVDEPSKCFLFQIDHQYNLVCQDCRQIVGKVDPDKIRLRMPAIQERIEIGKLLGILNPRTKRQGERDGIRIRDS